MRLVEVLLRGLDKHLRIPIESDVADRIVLDIGERVMAMTRFDLLQERDLIDDTAHRAKLVGKDVVISGTVFPFAGAEEEEYDEDPSQKFSSGARRPDEDGEDYYDVPGVVVAFDTATQM